MKCEFPVTETEWLPFKQKLLCEMNLSYKIIVEICEDKRIILGGQND